MIAIDSTFPAKSDGISMVDLSVSNSIKIVPSLISSPFLTATFKILAASIPSPKSLSIIGCFFSAVDFSGLSVGLVSVGSVSGVSVSVSVFWNLCFCFFFSGSSFAVSDYMKVLSDAVYRWMPLEMTSLGTDGFGLSETRNNLRDHFEVSECYIVLAAANALLKQKTIDKKKHSEIVEKLNLNKDKINPMTK